ncbi:hypothetical protein J5X84_03540 [Streptosporangiaceae bacterium NEAU-GS5]|nr:hypothetical protein [Streptosporangiaceae bacterium NEAU-GS5]
MALYPSAGYRRLSIASGGVDDFMRYFEELRTRWIKVEFLQEYDESGFSGYEAFKKGNHAEAERLVKDMVRGQRRIYSHARKYDVSMTRIRVYQLPLSNYLTHYEFAAYLADIECGEDIRFLDSSEVSEILTGTRISDFVVFDDKKVITLIYDLETRSLREARLIEHPDLVRRYTNIADQFIEKSIPMLESPAYLNSVSV